MARSSGNSNAMQSLWGSGDPARDEARKNTAKSMISPSVGGETRPQQIYTPQCVLDVVAEVWPEGIALDPCAGPDSLVKAEVYYTEADNGLVKPWRDRTFFNPPYKDLKDWLIKAHKEGERHQPNHKELIGLFPVRTHRAWWRKVLWDCDGIGWLDPLKFEGFKQAFPAPLCLAYWGQRRNAFLSASKRLSK